MLFVPKAVAQGLLAILTIGGLAVCTDRAARGELERAVRGLATSGRVPTVRTASAPADTRYTTRGLDQQRMRMTIEMVGTETNQ